MFARPLTFCFKRYSSCRIWKKPIDNACFTYFATLLDLIRPKFCTKTTPTLIFVASFQWNMLPSININNFNWNSVVMKILLKPQKFTIFLPKQICAKMGSLWATPKTKNIFFAGIIRPDHKLSKTFYFIKISYFG